MYRDFQVVTEGRVPGRAEVGGGLPASDSRVRRVSAADIVRLPGLPEDTLQ